MKPRLVVAAAALCALTACGGGDRPGNPAVYDRIAGTDDCATLQQEFDTASANHDRSTGEAAEAATAYMSAADDRMREVGCY